MYQRHFQREGKNHFWFKGKAELIQSLCREFLSPQNSQRILEIGAGEGDIVAVLAHYGTVTALDMSTEALERIPSHLHVKKTTGDAVALPFPDHAFDAICLFDVLEHIQDDTKAIQEALRVLKPGGLLFVTVPLHQRLFSSHDRANDHKRRYAASRIPRLLGNCTMMRMGYWNCMLLPMIALIRILRRKKPARFDDDTIPQWVNDLFWKIIHCENWLIANHIPLPWGLSFFGVFRKA